MSCELVFDHAFSVKKARVIYFRRYITNYFMSASHGSFATTINCMDGRSVEPTIAWMKSTYGVSYVDTITEPGMDKYCGSLTGEARAWLRRKIEISLRNHGSRAISVVGHDECAGNPVSKEEHVEQTREDVKLVEEIVDELGVTDPVSVVGLWVAPTGPEGEWVVERI